MILITASFEATTYTIQATESDDNASESRVIAFELQVERAGDADSLILQKIGDWSIDGYAESVTLQQELDGMSHLFWFIL